MTIDKPVKYVIGTPDAIQVSLPSRLSLIGILECAARQLCERSRFEEMETMQVCMAVVEAATNAVQHGHKRDADKFVEVEFRVWSDRIEIDVCDSGPGFDPSTLDDSITSEEKRFLGGRGRGIFIMRSAMDSVKYSFEPGRTTCRLLKHRGAAAAANG